MPIHKYFATTAKNIEPLLLDELKAMGVKIGKGTHLGVAFEGELELAYRACLWSRLAHHIFLELKFFEAPHREALYKHIKSVDWSKNFSPQETFRIDVSGKHPTLTHPHFIAQIAKDAIVDQFRDKTGERPSIAAEHPDIVLQLHIRENNFTLYLDLSGESLHKRGIRLETGIAPLKETLASAILIRAGWPTLMKAPNTMLFDPMCGAGTLLLEGTMMAYDIAPGLLRDYFGFLGWRGHQKELWKKLIQEAKLRHQKGLQETNLPVLGFDTNVRTLMSAEQNFRKLGLMKTIQFEKRDAANLDHPLLKIHQGLLVTNPPYGKRLMAGEQAQIEAMYARLGEAAKSYLQRWRLGIFTQEAQQVKAIKMRPLKQYQFLNGTLKCSLITFEIDEKHFWKDKPCLNKDT